VDGGLAIFSVNPTGTLSQLPGTKGCITETGHDQNGGLCTAGHGLKAPYGSVLSTDGKTLYVMSDTLATGSVDTFSLNPSTGLPTQLQGKLGCISNDGSDNGTPGVCGLGRALNEAWSGALSPDGTSLYVPAETSAGLAVFRPELAPACRALSASTVKGHAVTLHLTCVDPDGQKVTFALVRGPVHGKLGPVNQNAHTVTYTPVAGFVGRDSFRFRASDGAHSSAAALATLVVQPPKRT
jgi:DNA-binding beta-propeller fold protein YncE